MKIIATHLFNDYSGSPKVLMQLLKGWNKHGITTQLYTCAGREGFLSDLPDVKYSFFNYRFAANPVIRFVNLMVSQIILCVKILKNTENTDIIYVNTVLPFGAAVAGKLKGNRVIYHIHETSMKPAILKSFLFGIVEWCATDIVYVSNYLADQESFSNKKMHVLHNAIENEFLSKAEADAIEKEGLSNVLMVCSLKTYKGINEFVQLSNCLPHHNFRLVLNANKNEIADYFKKVKLPENLEIFETQSNVHPFYKWADVVLNLSKPNEWVETFGLTIIEGMAYGNPAIVPPVGGVTEVIENGVNGFTLDSDDIVEIANKIGVWTSNDNYFKSFRKSARSAVAQYNEDRFILKNIQILETK